MWLTDDLRKILFSKINKQNRLFTNYNDCNKVCFFFNNTDSYISRLTASFIFQAFERRKKLTIFNYTIQLYYFVFPFLLFLTHIAVNGISVGNTMYRNGNTE